MAPSVRLSRSSPWRSHWRANAIFVLVLVGFIALGGWLIRDGMATSRPRRTVIGVIVIAGDPSRRRSISRRLIGEAGRDRSVSVGNVRTHFG